MVAVCCNLLLKRCAAMVQQVLKVPFCSLHIVLGQSRIPQTTSSLKIEKARTVSIPHLRLVIAHLLTRGQQPTGFGRRMLAAPVAGP
jgi:hypothetical protein